MIRPTPTAHRPAPLHRRCRPQAALAALLATLCLIAPFSQGSSLAATPAATPAPAPAAATADGAAQPAAEAPPLATAPLTQLAAFEWPDASGKPFDAIELKGKPVVINFWATWCAPCIKEMPALSALSQELGKSAHFLGISLDRPEQVQRFVKNTPVAFPLLIADFRGLSLSRTWGNAQGQMPFTVVLNAQGALHWQHAGIVDIDKLRSMLTSADLR